jgi:hypothetical protein
MFFRFEDGALIARIQLLQKSLRQFILHKTEPTTPHHGEMQYRRLSGEKCRFQDAAGVQFWKERITEGHRAASDLNGIVKWLQGSYRVRLFSSIIRLHKVKFSFDKYQFMNAAFYLQTFP